MEAESKSTKPFFTATCGIFSKITKIGDFTEKVLFQPFQRIFSTIYNVCVYIL